jgi:hypothetical protein
MLLKLLKDYQPHHVAMVFDVGRVTFRTELYPAYKANRQFWTVLGTVYLTTVLGTVYLTM